MRNKFQSAKATRYACHLEEWSTVIAWSAWVKDTLTNLVSPFLPKHFPFIIIERLKMEKTLIVLLLSRIIYCCINCILFLCFLFPFSDRWSSNMVPWICQYMLWFHMSLIFSLNFFNLMTYLIYQGNLSCCAMHKPNRLTVVYGSTPFIFLFFPLAF